MRTWYEKAEESLYDDYDRGILTSKELQEALLGFLKRHLEILK